MVFNTFDQSESLMADIMRVVSEEQQAKFLLWVEKNQACIQMLNHLWALTNRKARSLSEAPQSAKAGAAHSGATPSE